MPKTCDVGCQADIQNWQSLQPEVGTFTQDKPLEHIELQHPLDSKDTVKDEEVELPAEEEMACRMFRGSLHEEHGCIFHVVLHDVGGA